MSAALFIASLEFGLVAKSLDVWSLPDAYEAFLKRTQQNWDEVRMRQDYQCMKYATIGGRLYNVAIFAIFVALGLTLLPYNILLGGIATAIGWISELIQMRIYRSDAKKIREP